MKSNYLKSLAPPEPEPKEDDEEVKQEEDLEQKPDVKSPEQIEKERQERIADAMHRARHAAISFMTLSTDTIYEIH